MTNKIDELIDRLIDAAYNNFSDGRIDAARAALRAAIAEKDARIKELETAMIVTDTNGQRCLLCDGYDIDGEGVWHKRECLLAERISK